MKFSEVQQIVGQVPFITEENAKQLYDFIVENKLKNILELGFAYGTASCYIAAALDELGGGKLVSVDLLEMKSHFSPSIEEQLGKLKLTQYVEIHRMETGYNWFLHNDIERNSTDSVCKQVYDFCIIDGPKNWTIDGGAFFMVDKLLKENGWIVFDDYSWTYAKADKNRSSTDGITHRNLSESERQNPQIKEVFNLLVTQHPNYGNFKVELFNDWAWAQKTKSDQNTIKYSLSISAIIKNRFFKFIKRMMH